MWPADQEQPLASILNWGPGQGATPNHVTTALDADGRFSLYNSAGSVDVIVDVVGLYEPAGAGGGGGVAGPAGPEGPKGETARTAKMAKTGKTARMVCPAVR